MLACLFLGYGRLESSPVFSNTTSINYTEWGCIHYDIMSNVAIFKMVCHRCMEHFSRGFTKPLSCLVPLSRFGSEPQVLVRARR
jgi:hypothetical protein